MIRSGRWKYCYYHGEPPELFDLVADPREHHNLAGSPDVAAIESALKRRVLAGWNPDEVERQIRRSQRARGIIGRATGVRRTSPEPQGSPLGAGVLLAPGAATGRLREMLDLHEFGLSERD
jgi:hypothetical protein